MLIKKYLKKILPNTERIANDSSLSRVSHYLINPLLWHINRRSVPKGAAIGLFIAFLPLPLQMLLAALLSIVFKANLPIAVVLTWITNPLTFLPINYFIYKVGELFVLNGGYHVVSNFDFEFENKSWGAIISQLSQWVHSAGKPFLVGLPIVAVSASILGYFGVRLMWRLSIYWRIRNRKRKAHRSPS